MVNCDATLREILGRDTVMIDMISLCVKEKLKLMDPIEWIYNVDYSEVCW